MIEQVFLKVLNMSITAGYCVIAVMLLRLLLRKMPKIYSYVLWSVVYFRLVCPVSFESVLSLIRINTKTVPEDIGMQITPRIQSGIGQIDESVNAGMSQVIPAAQTGASINPMQVVLAVAGMIWAVGTLGVLVYSAWSVFSLRRQLRNAVLVEENIYEAENLQTPFVIGVFRPRIYLPEVLGETERELVLLHERTHIRRRDYLIKQGAFLVSCIHWFNPLVWIAFYLMSRDMEMSCDESVIKRLGGRQKKEYSASLLSLASGRQILNGSPLAFGEGGIKARITNVLRYQNPKRWVSIGFVVILSVVLLGLAVNPKEAEGAGGMTGPVDTASGDNADYKKKEQPVVLNNQRIASADMPLGEGGMITVELWMTEGEYFDESHAAPSVGIYAENYKGSYELRTLDAAGEITDVLDFADVPSVTFNGGLNFPGEFALTYTDYNKDGCPDFTVGQAGSSSIGFYRLFTVRENGKIEELCKTDIPMDTTDMFSVVFEHDTESERMPFLGRFWNNAQGVGEHWFYYYNEETGLYEEGEKIVPDYEDDTGDEMNQGVPDGEDNQELVAVAVVDEAFASGVQKQAHREGWQDATLHMYVPEYAADSEWLDLGLLSQERSDALAQRALQELYDLTGTRIEECRYYYDATGTFSFALTEGDMERQRNFYSRTFGEETEGDFFCIPSMRFASARRVWYSPVQQYDLPTGYDAMTEAGQAVWFLTQSALYNCADVEKCIPDYEEIPGNWRINMADGTAYLVQMDSEIDMVMDITGPYPDGEINH